MDKKKLLIRIIVPILVLAVLTVIWIVKTHPTPTAIDNNLVTAENKEDFLLETTSVDLETLTAYGLPIIIDFGSDSCILCKEIAPVL